MVNISQDVATVILAGVCCIREVNADKGTSRGVPGAVSVLGRGEGTGLLRAQAGQGEVAA